MNSENPRNSSTDDDAEKTTVGMSADAASHPDGAAGSDPAPKWRLRPLQLPDHPELISITDGVITFGRDPGNSIVLSERDFPHVSSHHARITERDGELVLDDLGSKNGTFVNREPVERRRLSHGDVVQLGERGPRFAVLSSTGGGSDTVSLVKQNESPRPRIGATTIIHVKKALGIPEEAHVGEMLQSGSKDQSRRLALVSIIGLLIIGTAGYFGYGYVTDLLEQTENDAKRISHLSRSMEEVQQQLDDANALNEEQNRQWREQKQSLIDERNRLNGRIAQLEEVGRESAGELEGLKKQLEVTEGLLELYNPVNVAQSRLEKVAKVGEAVVFIEKKVYYRDKGKDVLLFFDEGAAPGTSPANLDEIGEPFAREGTGSGFTVGPHGFVISNAHVVVSDDDQRTITFDDTELTPEVKLNVIFSGESRRYPAEVIDVAATGTDDLALLKINPFEGMPYLETLDTSLAMPQRGTEVFLFGFPLGRQALHQGETVIASTFKGILSRTVDSFLQVDAGVYPGNSGGPITDVDGNVIGIVTAVQRTQEGRTAAGIGYGLSIERVSAIWPPSKADGGSD